MFLIILSCTANFLLMLYNICTYSVSLSGNSYTVFYIIGTALVCVFTTIMLIVQKRQDTKQHIPLVLLFSFILSITLATQYQRMIIAKEGAFDCIKDLLIMMTAFVITAVFSANTPKTPRLLKSDLINKLIICIAIGSPLIARFISPFFYRDLTDYIILPGGFLLYAIVLPTFAIGLAYFLNQKSDSTFYDVSMNLVKAFAFWIAIAAGLILCKELATLFVCTAVFIAMIFLDVEASTNIRKLLKKLREHPKYLFAFIVGLIILAALALLLLYEVSPSKYERLRAFFNIREYINVDIVDEATEKKAEILAVFRFLLLNISRSGPYGLGRITEPLEYRVKQWESDFWFSKNLIVDGYILSILFIVIIFAFLIVLYKKSNRLENVYYRRLCQGLSIAFIFGELIHIAVNCCSTFLFGLPSLCCDAVSFNAIVAITAALIYGLENKQIKKQNT